MNDKPTKIHLLSKRCVSVCMFLSAPTQIEKWAANKKGAGTFNSLKEYLHKYLDSDDLLEINVQIEKIPYKRYPTIEVPYIPDKDIYNPYKENWEGDFIPIKGELVFKINPITRSI